MRRPCRQVFLVVKLDSQEIFAMKVMSLELLLRRDMLEQSNVEQQLQDVAEHPLVVHFCYAFSTKSYVCILMEYLRGGDLFSFLSAQPSRRFSEDAIRFYAAEIAVALNHLHSKGILYRDLKLENVLIDETGHIRLTDFGLAKQVLSQRTSSVVGTPEYMAPEMFDKTKGYDDRIDWWAFGVLLFTLLIGKYPNVDFDIEAQLAGFNISANLVNLIKKLLRKKPRQRLAGKDVFKHPFFKNMDWTRVAARGYDAPVAPTPAKVPSPPEYASYPVMTEDIISGRSRARATHRSGGGEHHGSSSHHHTHSSKGHHHRSSRASSRGDLHALAASAASIDVAAASATAAAAASSPALPNPATADSAANGGASGSGSLKRFKSSSDLNALREAAAAAKEKQPPSTSATTGASKASAQAGCSQTIHHAPSTTGDGMVSVPLEYVEATEALVPVVEKMQSQLAQIGHEVKILETTMLTHVSVIRQIEQQVALLTTVLSSALPLMSLNEGAFTQLSAALRAKSDWNSKLKRDMERTRAQVEEVAATPLPGLGFVTWDREDESAEYSTSSDEDRIVAPRRHAAPAIAAPAAAGSGAASPRTHRAVSLTQMPPESLTAAVAAAVRTTAPSPQAASPRAVSPRVSPRDAASDAPPPAEPASKGRRVESTDEMSTDDSFLCSTDE